MRITPIDIQQQQFKSRLMGYDKAGVDQFLEILAGEMERLLRQNQDLQEELTHARNALGEMRAREAMLKETLLTTQKVTDELKANARREAELLLADAELRAERVMINAEERRLQLVDEIREIKRQRIDFETTLRSVLEKHARMLDLNVLVAEPEHADTRQPGALSAQSRATMSSMPRDPAALSAAPPVAAPEPSLRPASPSPEVTQPAAVAVPVPKPRPGDEISFEIPLVDDSRRKPLP